MSEPTYTLTITETERTLLSRALGLFVTKLTNAPIFVESPSGGTQAAAANPAPVIEQRDRWARDRRGRELPNPEGSVARQVHLSKTEQKMPRKAGGKPFLKVTWEAHDRGFVDANCFDDQLWPWLINQRGKPTTLYLVKSGEYLNVVGVRA